MASSRPQTDADRRSRNEPAAPAVTVHGAPVLAAVSVDACNSQIREEDGFVGDRARRAAFFDILDRWRNLARRPAKALGDTPTADLSKTLLDELLVEGKPHEQALIFSAVEDYASELIVVIRRLLRTREWRDTQRIVVGGGLKGGRFAEIAIARAELIARADGIEIELVPIRAEPDEAGLIGAVHLAPSWMFASFDHILAVDIGGTNIRAGIVKLNLDKAEDLSKARVAAMELWRHAEEKLTRDAAVDRLAGMLGTLIEQAEAQGFNLAPFIGIGCPGAIAPDGAIETGAQNLPGNWESRRFNLPTALWEAIPAIGGRETTLVMHNDAVVQGLSEVPFMGDVERWGVITIGTGLGNARFTNRSHPNAEETAARERHDDKRKAGKDKSGKEAGKKDKGEKDKG
ncbi:ROK family protein [Ancylobacter amanitiformis]|uniref:ROK family protein n=1 Tax=Ancylobacter amanitiformis TaxID=217069 RepID=A0ABU0LRE2_9HYPH|nr:ROK family protein [Ancylobacter amanitiformis]MDQ0511277.1 hypothetical protein [Ancylobacter amanitiformis]